MKDNRYAAPCCALAALRHQMDRTQQNHYAHRSIGHHALPSLAWNHLPVTLHEISWLAYIKRFNEMAEELKILLPLRSLRHNRMPLNR
uniref:Uncharacterized protein n=1 Tax=Magnetococcus massalia (strain MO-1) TaxID=451514 RepID=A0A1S7LFP0_MAGMO|nr:protein of unknown function [Candidatus Magnetococcus massalia]